MGKTDDIDKLAETWLLLFDLAELDDISVLEARALMDVKRFISLRILKLKREAANATTPAAQKEE